MLRCTLLLLAACGRFGFDATPQRGDGSNPTGDAIADATGSAGPRWVAVLGNGARNMPVVGANGAPAVAFQFVGSTQVAGQMLTASAQQTASAVVQFDAMGTVKATTVLDAQYTCDARGLTMRGTNLLVAAFSNGGQMTALGPCSVSTGRQDPLVLEVDPTGAASLLVHGSASGLNAQDWNIAALPDGSYEASGIYSGGLTFGTTSLPAAGADPNGFMVRLTDTGTSAVWAHTVNGGVQIAAGQIAVDGTDACTVGSFDGAGITAFGTVLPYVGSVDDYMARLDANGVARFVEGFGSTGADSDFGDATVAVNGSGCTASIKAPADVTIGTTTLPVSAGGAIVVTYDGSGAFVGGFRTPDRAMLTTVGTTVIAAYSVTAPVTIGSTTYTPEGTDTIVVEISASGPRKLLGAIGGAGDQTPLAIGEIGPDAVGITVVTSGELVFGATTVQTVANDHALAVLGI